MCLGSFCFTLANNRARRKQNVTSSDFCGCCHHYSTRTGASVGFCGLLAASRISGTAIQDDAAKRPFPSKCIGDAGVQCGVVGNGRCLHCRRDWSPQQTILVAVTVGNGRHPLTHHHRTGLEAGLARGRYQLDYPHSCAAGLGIAGSATAVSPVPGTNSDINGRSPAA